ncbi:DUF4837 family protein [Aureisphaera galaxeae]|uniref:DUF4837 family protein n=1 Tax=Aureisphaera galaxeae TaxID=1538023 RepID=UPI002350E34C|nr:DUF4837 family protein [Aureisphaera galaxeae]MDC8005086.1 DUF4837 family protein [Aureisphaera galaxeae]
MKNIYYFLLAGLLLLVACQDSASSKRDTSILTDSVGRINGLQVVVSNDLWNGPVGEKVREHFAALVDGLPQQEPLFTINQLNPDVFEGFARTYRTFVHIKLGDKDTVILKKNSYARPQIGAFVTGTSEEKIMELLDTEQARIVAAFRNAELKERQKRTKRSVKKIDSLKERFGLSLKVPSAYRLAAASDDYYWMRKDLKQGTTNILIYQIPMSFITNDSTAIGDIIKMRDSIGSGYLPVEDDALFITEEAYAPYLFTTEIDGKFAYETKGTWEVKDAFMAGPFLNYAIRDEANSRYLILEGFTYAPSVEKRDLQFELESILKSAKIE